MMFLLARGIAPMAVVAMATLILPGLAAPGHAQDAQAAQQAPQALSFPTGAGILFHQIKSDRTEDFEWMMQRLHEALTKSEDPKHQSMAGSMRVFKNTDPLPTGNIMYVVLVNPAVADGDYSMTSLLNLVYKTFPEEQQEIYKRVSGAFGGATNRLNLQAVGPFGK